MLQTEIQAVVIIGGSILVSLLGMFVVRRKVRLETLEAHKEVAGFILGVVGALYAIVLGFVIIVVWEQFEDAKKTVAAEASQLADLFRLSRGFSPAVHEEVRGAAVGYARATIEEEWPAMARGRHQSRPQPHEAYDRLWTVYQNLQVTGEREAALYGESLDRLTDLADSRRHRLYLSEDSIPGIVWLMLWVGAVITLGGTYFFGLRNVVAQSHLVGLLATLISFCLFTIVALDHPFSGRVRIGPNAFESALQSLEMRGL